MSISREQIPLLGLKGEGEEAVHGTWRETGFLREFGQEMQRAHSDLDTSGRKLGE